MPNLVLIGMKHCGKTTLASYLASQGWQTISLDQEISRLLQEKHHLTLTNRQICQRFGEDYFRSLETEALRHLTSTPRQSTVLDCGGGAPLRPENATLLRSFGIIIFLDLAKETNYSCLISSGVPAFFPYPEDPRRSFEELYTARRPAYLALADHTLPLPSLDTPTLAQAFSTLKLTPNA